MKEIYTGALYVTENELQKVWKERPGYAYTAFDPVNPVLVAGETDKKKIEALNKYARMTGQFKLGNIDYYSRPVFFERLDAENEYEYLHTINGKLARSKVILKALRQEAPGKDPVVSYEVTAYNNEMIEPLTLPAAVSK